MLDVVERLLSALIQKPLLHQHLTPKGGWVFLLVLESTNSVPLVPSHESLGDTCWPDGWTGGQQALLYTTVSKLTLSGAVGMKPGNSVVLQIAPMVLFLQIIIPKGYYCYCCC